MGVVLFAAILEQMLTDFSGFSAQHTGFPGTDC
ncbi:hypothetical protein DES37_102335 [Mangrovibacter plantisponsor]|uniref:Uncharacterized protein n=1 Tax=Mangrovibacter plantisponsor TaxID=451513 RepID=A0A317Q558_9ENTR|nr:hypothetical protein DES37_102335 [Mangrovibacter plantisponsor]